MYRPSMTDYVPWSTYVQQERPRFGEAANQCVEKLRQQVRYLAPGSEFEIMAAPGNMYLVEIKGKDPIMAMMNVLENTACPTTVFTIQAGKFVVNQVTLKYVPAVVNVYLKKPIYGRQVIITATEMAHGILKFKSSAIAINHVCRRIKANAKYCHQLAQYWKPMGKTFSQHLKTAMQQRRFERTSALIVYKRKEGITFRTDLNNLQCFDDGSTTLSIAVPYPNELEMQEIEDVEKDVVSESRSNDAYDNYPEMWIPDLLGVDEAQQLLNEHDDNDESMDLDNISVTDDMMQLSQADHDAIDIIDDLTRRSTNNDEITPNDGGVNQDNGGNPTNGNNQDDDNRYDEFGWDGTIDLGITMFDDLTIIEEN